MNREQKREIVGELLRAKRRDLAVAFAQQTFVSAGSVSITEDLAMTSRSKDQNTQYFKFTGKTKRGGVAMFTVMVGDSGLVSTKNTKGTPIHQHVHLAIKYARQQTRG